MSKFKVRDRLKQIDYILRGENPFVRVTRIDKDLVYHIHDGEVYEYSCPEDCFIKIGDSQMSKYDELKAQIEALDNGWTKEADDILVELKKGKYELVIIDLVDGSGRIYIYSEVSATLLYWNDSDALTSFIFTSQCQKHQAFKNVLLWLLDHSDIKQDLVGEELKAEIEGKVYKVKVLEKV